MKLRTAVLLAATVLASTAVLQGRNMNAQEQPPKPPIAKKVPKTTQIHGYTVTDDYAWLADKTKTDKDVLAYLKAEDDYAKAMMKPTEGFQEALYKEMLGRIKETDENVPYKKGEYFYYTRTEQGKQYPIYCRKKGGLTAPEEVTIDMNEMAKGHEYFSIGAHNVSEDGNLLAFSTDTTGFRQYNLFVKDLGTGKISDKLAERVFKRPCKIGRPTGLGGLSSIAGSPIYSTGVGLLLYGLQHEQELALTESNLFHRLTRFFKKAIDWY